MISIVIPIFNESQTIPILWDRLHKVISSLEYRTEVIFVNDGSTDDSFEKLYHLHENNKSIIRIITFSRNFGHQNALTAGIDSANGIATILMDGDLQDTPETLPQFIKKWEEGYDVVYATRINRKESLLKRLAFSWFYRIQKTLVNFSIPPDAGIFSLMDKKVIDVLKSMPERNRHISGLRGYIGFNQIGIPVERERRYEGEPRVSIIRLVKLAFDGFFSLSNLPLRIATLVGIIIALTSFVFSLWILFMKFIGEASPGWASNLIATFFMGGIQLIFLGIIGEYLGRIYDENKKRPYYIIDQTLGFDKDSNLKQIK